MQWKKERDLLIAQTMAFVQSVAGKVTSADSRTEARFDQARVDLPSADEAFDIPPVPVVPKVAVPVDVVPAERISQLGHSDLRDEIKRRVTAFRARQQLFDRDRDEYCKTMMAKARAASENAIRISDSRASKR